MLKYVGIYFDTSIFECFCLATFQTYSKCKLFPRDNIYIYYYQYSNFLVGIVKTYHNINLLSKLSMIICGYGLSGNVNYNKT